MEHAHRLTLDLDDRDFADLAAIAAQEDRSPSDIAAETLRARLDEHRAFVADVEEGLAQIRAGDVLSTEDMIALRTEQRRRALKQRALASE